MLNNSGIHLKLMLAEFYLKILKNIFSDDKFLFCHLLNNQNWAAIIWKDLLNESVNK